MRLFNEISKKPEDISGHLGLGRRPLITARGKTFWASDLEQGFVNPYAPSLSLPILPVFVSVTLISAMFTCLSADGVDGPQEMERN